MNMAPPPPWSGRQPWPQPPPYPQAGPPARGRGLRWLVIAAVLVVLGGYLVALVLTSDRWAPGDATEERTTVTWQPASGVDADPADLDRARGVLERRAAAEGVRDVRVSVDGDALVLSAPGTDEDRWARLGATGRLDLRPVVISEPAQTTGTPPPGLPTDATAQEVADEKELRQSDDISVQMLALQFQASRCADQDALAGQDDPQLPLITCSTDGQEVYLLDKTLLDGEQIRSATARFEDGIGEYVVEVRFDDEGARVWKDFTGANIGTQVAFTIDTAVVSAPEIREAIPGGLTQITGQFTEEQADALAAILSGGALPIPLTMVSSDTEVVAVQTNPTPWRITVAVAGVVVVALVVGGVLLLVRLGRTGPGPYAADVTRYTS